MNSIETFLVATILTKRAGIGNELAAGASGLFGPLGAYAYSKNQFPNNEHVRSDIIARTALGGSIGGLAGTAAGIPISMATGIPVLPGVLLSALLGAAGGGAGAAWASNRAERHHGEYEQRKIRRKEKLKKLRQRRDPDNIEQS